MYNDKIKTKFGNARINKDGYYIITSRKEGNHGKLLHRVIATNYFGNWINDPNDFYDIHHLDGNRKNNCVFNLEPIPHSQHLSIHNSGENNNMYGKTGENSHLWKKYARIIKTGKYKGKQYYGIKFQGRKIKEGSDKKKLIEWFCINYPNEEIKGDI